MNYNVTFPENLDTDLVNLARKLKTSPADVICMALALLKHASDADEIKLISKGIEQKVLVK